MGQKSQLFVLSKSCHTWYLEDADSYLKICFLNFELKTYFLPNLGQKSHICPFCQKIVPHVTSRLLILVPAFVFSISKPKSIFGQIWTEKLKVVQFDRKLSISTMLTLIPTLLFSASNPKSFFGQIWAEKFKVVHFD